MVKVQPSLVAQVWFPGAEPHHLSVSGHAVVAYHIEELEEFTANIYNHALGLWGRNKKIVRKQVFEPTRICSTYMQFLLITQRTLNKLSILEATEDQRNANHVL